MPESAHYELRSELARWSLVSRRSQSDRRLAWVNSVCLLFLVIGLVGARTRPPLPKPVAPLEEQAPVLYEPTPPPPTQVQAAPQETEPEKAPAAVVVVVPNSPAINFSVPTVGTLVAPQTMAAAPPAQELRANQAPRRPAAPTQIGNTGAGGDRPEPPYPTIALQNQEQGTVVLLLTADAAGRVAGVEIKQSSGSAVLDGQTKDFVRRRWKLPPGEPGRVFEASIRYVLE